MTIFTAIFLLLTTYQSWMTQPKMWTNLFQFLIYIYLLQLSAIKFKALSNYARFNSFQLKKMSWIELSNSESYTVLANFQAFVHTSFKPKLILFTSCRKICSFSNFIPDVHHVFIDMNVIDLDNFQAPCWLVSQHIFVDLFWYGDGKCVNCMFIWMKTTFQIVITKIAVG